MIKIKKGLISLILQHLWPMLHLLSFLRLHEATGNFINVYTIRGCLTLYSNILLH